MRSGAASSLSASSSPAHSLRRQLLSWLLPLYVVTAVIATFCSYVMFSRAANFFMDNQLRVLADSHADSAGSTPSLQSLTAHNVYKGDLIVQIWDRNGRLLTTSWPDLDLPPQRTPGFHEITTGDTRWRVYTLPSADGTVQSVQDLNFRDRTVREHTLQAGLPFVFLIPISALILWWVIALALRRLELAARAAALQDEHTFGELPIEHAPTEIRPLVHAVNTLLMRLRSAFASQRRFVQDAAHELRTPITAMSLQLENLKTRISDRTTAEQVAQLEKGLARTRRLVEQLLRLARQEAPRSTDRPTPVELAGLLKEIIAELMPLADHRRIDLGFAASIDAGVHASADDLRSVLHNLVDNALRYTSEGGVVDVTLHDAAGAVTVEIVDSGPGIPPELLPRVYDRFFRIEGSDMEGSGLGLAIAKHAAQRNQIELELLNRLGSSGLIARVRFKEVPVSTSTVAEPAAIQWARTGTNGAAR